MDLRFSVIPQAAKEATENLPQTTQRELASSIPNPDPRVM